jgi:hypothetical protein
MIIPGWVAGSVNVGEFMAPELSPDDCDTAANPKSSNFTTPCGVIMMFAGFKSMDDAFVMRRFERIRDLLGIVDRRVDAKRTSQGLAFDQFHDQDAFLDTIDVGNVRMIERGQNPRFALESGTALGILRNRRRQHFDRNFALELRVLGSIHLAHAARADFGFYAVPTELLSGSKLGAPRIGQDACVLPCGAIQHRLARACLRQQSFHGAPHVGIGFREQRRPLLAGNLQRGVIKRFH